MKNLCDENPHEIALTEIPEADEAGFSPKVDENVVLLAAESDRAYREITKRIVDLSEEQLFKHTDDKNNLRKGLFRYIKIFLAIQYGFLVFLLLCNQLLALQISDFVFNVYIVSVFVETLGGLLVMIRYAFASEQEVKLIEILTAIVASFKKFDDDDDDDDKKKQTEKEEKTHVR